jgi:DNA polymerase-3 subunit epsilon
MNNKPTQEEITGAKEQATLWAKERLKDTSTVILDIETTGLLTSNPNSEIVQISMCNIWGSPLINMVVKPNYPIGWEALKIHKISEDMVASSPTFPEIAPLLYFLLNNKHVVCYGANFDIHFVMTMFTKYGFDLPDITISCCMEMYAMWQGEWNKSKGSWKWQKLPHLAFGSAHDSLTDCLSTLMLIKRMSGEDIFENDKDLISLDF